MWQKHKKFSRFTSLVILRDNTIISQLSKPCQKWKKTWSWMLKQNHPWITWEVVQGTWHDGWKFFLLQLILNCQITIFPWRATSIKSMTDTEFSQQLLNCINSDVKLLNTKKKSKRNSGLTSQCRAHNVHDTDKVNRILILHYILLCFWFFWLTSVTYLGLDHFVF